MNTTLATILKMLLNLLPGMLSNMRPTVVAAFTVPQHEIEQVCAGMTPAQVAEAIALGRKKANAEADLVLFIASRGTITPTA
jgi:hypothetical protein